MARGRSFALPSVVAACLLSPVTAATAAPEPPEVALTFPQQPSGSVLRAFPSSGSASVATSVVTANGGAAVVTARRGAGSGSAVRLPAFDAGGSAPRAMLKVVNTGTQDALSPGRRDFSWGADFALDAVSASAAADSTDNGDNLVQRGLAGHDQQYKLQLDHRQPTCHVKGSAGQLQVAVPVTVEPGAWYRATCARSGTRLTATLSRLDESGAVVRTWSRSAAGPIGTLDWKDPQVPLAVGGKLSTTGAVVVGASDQFNGLVDEVVLDIAPQ